MDWTIEYYRDEKGKEPVADFIDSLAIETKEVMMKEGYTRGRTVKEHITQKMKGPKFKKAWHALDTEFELLESMIKAREKAGLTQEELAKRIGTKQPALSRLERGAFKKATVETLSRVADALDAKLVIKLQPRRG